MTSTSQSLAAVETGSALQRHAPAISLFIAIVAFSFAGVFLRLGIQAGVSPEVIAASRLLLSAIIVTPWVATRYRHELTHLGRRELLFAAGAGVLVGIHFILLIGSLKYTTVLLNQVIINTGPIWVAVLEVTLLKVRFKRGLWVGMGIALTGGLLSALSGLDGNTSVASDIPLGNLMALIASIFGSGYMILGRSVRQKVSLIPYIWVVYLCGGIAATGIVALQGLPVTGFSPEGYLWIIAVTIVPQLIGHSLFNFALAYFPATFVTLSGQVVSFTAGMLAYLLFAEVPSLLELIGSGVIVAGVVWSISAQPAKPK